MHVAIFTVIYDPARGHGQALENLAKGLLRLGHQVTILPCRGPTEEYRLSGVSILELPSQTVKVRLTYFGFLKQEAISLLSDLRPNLVHTHEFFQPLSARLAIETKLKGYPHLISNEFYRPMPHWFQTIFDIYALSMTWVTYMAKRLTAPSRACFDTLVGYGASPEKISLIPNSVDIECFSPDKGDPSYLSSFNLDESVLEEKKIILAIAKMHPHKGIDILIHAFAKLQDEYNVRNSLLLLLGDGEYLGRYKSLVVSLGKSDSIRFSRDHISHERISHLLPLADVFCQPSFYDQFPNVVLEALSAGLPVVATDVGGIRDIIQTGENGLLVRAGNVEELSQALFKLIHHEDLQNRIALSARRSAIEQFSPLVVARKYSKVYDTMLP